MTPEREEQIRRAFAAMAVPDETPSWTRDLLHGLDAARGELETAKETLGMSLGMQTGLLYELDRVRAELAQVTAERELACDENAVLSRYRADLAQVKAERDAARGTVAGLEEAVEARIGEVQYQIGLREELGQKLSARIAEMLAELDESGQKYAAEYYAGQKKDARVAELEARLTATAAELEQVTAERDDLLRACRVAAFWNVHGMEAVHIHAMQMLLRLAVERNSEKKEG